MRYYYWCIYTTHITAISFNSHKKIVCCSRKKISNLSTLTLRELTYKLWKYVCVFLIENPIFHKWLFPLITTWDDEGVFINYQRVRVWSEKYQPLLAMVVRLFVSNTFEIKSTGIVAPGVSTYFLYENNKQYFSYIMNYHSLQLFIHLSWVLVAEKNCLLELHFDK